MPSKGSGGKAQGGGAQQPGGGRAGLVFGDGDRVLDKGVWKRWKSCQQCSQIVVERAKWKECWPEVRFCSDRCRAEAKRSKRAGAALGRGGAADAADAAGGAAG